MPRGGPVCRRQKQEFVDIVIVIRAFFQARNVLGQVAQRISVSGDNAPMPLAQILKSRFTAGDDFVVLNPQSKAFELGDSTAAVVAGGIGEDADGAAPCAQLIQPYIAPGIIVSPTFSTPNASKTKAST